MLPITNNNTNYSNNLLILYKKLKIKISKLAPIMIKFKNLMRKIIN